jgi:uncharacterized protein (TIGR00369 family)
MPPDDATASALPAGWKIMPASDYPALIGPFLARREEGGGGWRYAFVAERRHLNKGGVVHGGMLVSFADDALGATIWEAVGRRSVTTVQLNTQFIAPVRAGDLVEARAEVLRATRTVVFIRGVLEVGGRAVVHADGVWKILHA